MLVHTGSLSDSRRGAGGLSLMQHAAPDHETAGWRKAEGRVGRQSKQAESKQLKAGGVAGLKPQRRRTV